jgi:chromosome segregation ATPase
MSLRPTSPIFDTTLYVPQANTTPSKTVQTARGARYRMFSKREEETIQAQLAQLEASVHTHPERETVWLEKRLKEQDYKTLLAESSLARKKLILARREEAVAQLVSSHSDAQHTLTLLKEKRSANADTLSELSERLETIRQEYFRTKEILNTQSSSTLASQEAACTSAKRRRLESKKEAEDMLSAAQQAKETKRSLKEKLASLKQKVTMQENDLKEIQKKIP